MSNPTSNFGWVMPTNTDLVTDLPADFAVFGQGVDTSMADLLGGTTGQVLSKASNTNMDFTWITAEVGDITAVTAGTGLTGGGTTGAVTLAIDSTVATLTGSQTLTNKTLTTPVISSISNSGTVTIPTGTVTLSTLTGTETLTNKTLTSPIENNPTVKAPKERMTVSATAATGTIAYDITAQGNLYYTSNASANFTLNFTNVNANLAVGDSFSCVFLNTNGATAYYPNAFQIDSSSVTPKWSGGTAPSSGNASSIDSYSFIIIKTAATPTYTVLAGGAVKFA